MFTDPAIVHTVADLRREALLAEAVFTAHATPASATRRRPTRVAGYLMAQVATAISRIVDEFEPGPGPLPRDMGRLETRTRS